MEFLLWQKLELINLKREKIIMQKQSKNERFELIQAKKLKQIRYILDRKEKKIDEDD